MKTLSILFVATLSLAASGCKKGGADCDKAIANGMELGKAVMSGDAQVLAKLKDVGLQHCRDDKWSDDALTCMVEAKTQPEAQGCYGKLTKDQQDKMNKGAMEVMTAPGAAAPK
jgi:hypothetical protein